MKRKREKPLRFRQAIQVPERISRTVFELPCVTTVNKGSFGIAYTLLDGNIDVLHSKLSNPYRAHANDWICEEENGYWIILSNSEYRRNQELAKRIADSE